MLQGPIDGGVNCTLSPTSFQVSISSLTCNPSPNTIEHARRSTRWALILLLILPQPLPLWRLPVSHYSTAPQRLEFEMTAVYHSRKRLQFLHAFDSLRIAIRYPVPNRMGLPCHDS